MGGWEQTQTGFTWTNSPHFPIFCKFPLPWLYWAPLTPTLSPHSPFKMPSHLCKHPNKSDLSSVHARPFLCYWLKSVLTIFNQCPDLFIFGTTHQTKTFPLQHLIWFSCKIYEMWSLFTDRETESQGSHLLKATEQVCSTVPPTVYLLPWPSCREERTFESENDILIPKVTQLLVPSRSWSCPQVGELLTPYPSTAEDSMATRTEVCRKPGSELQQSHPIFPRSSQKLCSSAS